MYIQVVLPYHPQVRCADQIGGRRVIEVDPNFQIEQSETQTKTQRIYGAAQNHS